METAICIGVQDPSHTGELRRGAMQLASLLAFDETDKGNVGLVVTEAATNLLKHAGGGHVVVRAVDSDATVEMLALDKGPGIENIARIFQDGYSTTGTPGTGLGAISRISAFHDIYSVPAQGTALLAHIRRRGAARPVSLSRFRVGAVSLPMPGEPVCGDAWCWLDRPGGGRLLVADGLGHGALAGDAARLAVRVAGEHPGESVPDLMRRIHEALRPTRGAAVAVADVDPEHGLVRYTGVGNISGHVIPPSGPVRHMVSHSGTAGHEARKISEFTYPWDPDSLLILHSDGLVSRWSLDRYPGLTERHPALIAGILYRDFNRGRDDVTVVVLQAGKDTF